MTAQIAIMNRVGVALAADSAVSVRPANYGDRKIFTSSDKLFLLSNAEPIGVMINGRGEYLGMPVETLIKGFRDSPESAPCDTVFEYAQRFFEFLSREVGGSAEGALEFASNIALSRLQHIVDQFEEMSESKRVRGEAVGLDDLLAFCHGKIEAGLLTARGRPEIDGVGPGSLPNGIEEVVAYAIEQLVGEGGKAIAPPLAELVRLLMTRQIASGASASFVFAGFGTKQRFPAIVAAQCDGPLVDGHKIRFTDRDCVSDATPALIKPFAQSEMVNRLIDGVDASYSEFLTGMFDKALERYADHAISKVSKRKPSQSVRNELAALRERFVSEILSGADKFRVSTYRSALIESVQFMPKSDLAGIAKSLVNLQSINETVGGPIDVALISKHDGFVWIERKHYFEPGINSRFFAKLASRVNRWMPEHEDVER